MHYSVGRGALAFPSLASSRTASCWWQFGSVTLLCALLRKACAQCSQLLLLAFAAPTKVIVASCIFSLTAGLLCGLPLACFYTYTWFWRCPPGCLGQKKVVHSRRRWRTDLYEKMMYFVYYLTSGVGSPPPVAGPALLPVTGVVEILGQLPILLMSQD